MKGSNLSDFSKTNDAFIDFFMLSSVYNLAALLFAVYTTPVIKLWLHLKNDAPSHILM